MDTHSTRPAGVPHGRTPEGGRRLLVTGVTGFLGRHFVYSLRDREYQFVLLVRAGDEAEGLARVLASLEVAHAAYKEPFDAARWRPRLSVVVGDISAPACGLDAARLDALARLGVAEVWHFAASLNFEERNRQKIWTQNVTGTEHALALCRRVGAGRFVYCSTAYSVGKAGEGVVAEELHPLPREFNNLYEESKCAAEHQVLDFCRAAAIDCAILRPSIVVGPSATRSTGGSTSGVYGFLRSLHRFREVLQQVERELTVIADPEAKVNVVPVDEVMEDVRWLIDHDFPGGPCHHLTGFWYPALGPSLALAARLLGISPIIVRRRGERALSPLEELIARRTTFYASYLDSRAEFARALPRRYGVDTAGLGGYIAELFRELDQESPASIFAVERVTSFDGSELSCYLAGDRRRPAVVLVNAIGMPVEFWTRFAAELRTDYFVIALETRGVPNHGARCDLAHRGTDAHVADVRAVLGHLGVARAALVGWCTGAQIALRAAASAPELVRSVVALNPTLGVPDGTPRTDFERTLLQLFPRMAADRRLAELYYRVVYGNRAHAGEQREYESGRVEATEVLTSTDPALLHLTSLPFRTAAALERYAVLMNEALHDDARAWLPAIARPVLVYTGKRDATAHPALARRVADLVPGTRFVEDENGDHFSFYNDPSVLERVRRFLAEAGDIADVGEMAAADIGVAADLAATDLGVAADLGDVAAMQARARAVRQ